MKLKAKIYQPAKTAMQSGQAKTHHWVFEYVPVVKKKPEPLMGWNSGGTLEQIHLEFPTKEEAIAYAKEKDVAYEVVEPHQRSYKPKSYAENFSFYKKTAF